MSSDTPHKPPRREFLAVLGTAAISATAGCNSTSASDDEAATVAGGRTDWPTLGHDGANTGYNPNASGPRSGAKVKWKTRIGMTLGPPVVAGDRVFLTESDRLVCFDAKSGNELWEYAPDDGHTWASPTVRNGNVYAAATDNAVVEIDAKSGTEQRRFETKGNVDTVPRFDDDGEFMFSATSDGWVHCFDLKANELEWQTKVQGEIAAPPAIDPTSSSMYVATYWGEVFALSRTTGRAKWRRKLPSILHAAPAIIENSLYVPCFKGQVFSLDTNAGAGGTRWQRERGGSVEHHLGVADGSVFGTDGDEVFAIDAESGETRWTLSIAEYSVNSPVIAGDTLYVGDEAGKVYAIKTGGGTGYASNRFGAARWKRDLGSRVRQGLAVADGTLFAITEPTDAPKMLYALEEP
ncbi:PQQ-binding-like beta-propeller repeat protein [Haladaptatus sp. DFWS20]|uniref:outer membrane protein assembly factor BamB family protein n=1 Tax=Haladaptatus sp. DFWS20 TaxID=3403467 RepID=UPI003EC0F844